MTCSDKYSAPKGKNVMLGGLLLFAAGSVLGALAPNTDVQRSSSETARDVPTMGRVITAGTRMGSRTGAPVVPQQLAEFHVCGFSAWVISRGRRRLRRQGCLPRAAWPVRLGPREP